LACPLAEDGTREPGAEVAQGVLRAAIAALGAWAAGRSDRALDAIAVQGAIAAGKSDLEHFAFEVPGVPDTAAGSSGHCAGPGWGATDSRCEDRCSR
jgi:hypothetical protein